MSLLTTAPERRPTDPPPARAAIDSLSPAAGRSTATPGPRPKPAPRRLSPRQRKLVLAAHVLVGVGWLGVVAAKLALEIAVASAGPGDSAAAGYRLIGTLDRAVFPPAALATLLSGIVLSLGTAWGLFRHYWIVVKLILTVAVIVTGVLFVAAWTEAAAGRPAVATAAGLASTSTWLIGIGLAHLLMLAAATVISVYRPWGQIGPPQSPSRR